MIVTIEEYKTVIVDNTINDILAWAKGEDMDSLYGFISERVFSDFKGMDDEDIKEEAEEILEEWRGNICK